MHSAAGDCPSPPRLTTDLNGLSQRILLPVPGVEPAIWLKFEGLNPADPRTCERARENKAAGSSPEDYRIDTVAHFHTAGWVGGEKICRT